MRRLNSRSGRPVLLASAGETGKASALRIRQTVSQGPEQIIEQRLLSKFELRKPGGHRLTASHPRGDDQINAMLRLQRQATNSSVPDNWHWVTDTKKTLLALIPDLHSFNIVTLAAQQLHYLPDMAGPTR